MFGACGLFWFCIYEAGGGFAGGFDGNSFAGQGEPEISDNIYMTGLPLTASMESVKVDFSALGVNILSVKVLEAKEGKTSKAALIRFATEAEAKAVKDPHPTNAW